MNVYPTLEIGAGMDADRWVEQEFGDAELGDVRRTARLVKSVGLLARMPGQSITANLDMDRTAVSGYYCFMEHADTDEMAPVRLLAPHRQRTIERMRAQETVLCLVDETKITYNT